MLQDSAQTQGRNIADAGEVYAQYTARRETRFQQIIRVQMALDAYSASVEDDLLNSLRELAGEETKVPTVAESARELLNSVSFLPELSDPLMQGKVFVDPPLFPEVKEPVVQKPRFQETMPEPPPREPERSIFPHLTRIARDKSMLVIGGAAPMEDRILWARKHGVEIDWVPVKEHRSMGIVDTVVRMISEKEFMGAIVLDGELNESLVTRLKSTCANSDTPISYGHKGTAASLWQAFDGIERKYATKESLARVV